MHHILTLGMFTRAGLGKKKKAISEWDFTPLTHHNERNVLGVILNGTMPYLSHFAVFFSLLSKCINNRNQVPQHGFL